MKKLLLIIFIELFIHQSFSQKQITLADIWVRHKFMPVLVGDLYSMNDGEHYTVLELQRDIIKYKYKTGEAVDTIFSLRKIKTGSVPRSIEKYFFSKDETKILICTEIEHIYRYSYRALYYVWDISTQTLTPLSAAGKQQIPKFSPDSKNLAYVYENNIYIKNLDKNNIVQISYDGEKNKIINGLPDWVYEEEFSFNCAYEWSPDGKKIAYIKFNETDVKQYTIPVYSGLYTEQYTYKYPKAGEKNSIVSVHIYDLESRKTTTIDIGDNKDIYIPRIKWTKTKNSLCILRMNRLQNTLDYLIADANSGISKLIVSIKDKSYLEINDNLRFLGNGQFLITHDTSGYNHIYLYDINGNFLRQITKGAWNVTQINGISKEKSLIFYTSTEQGPMERHIYSIKIDGSNKKLLTRNSGVNDAAFSKTCMYFINIFSNANTPPRITVNRYDGKEIRVIEDNQDLIKRIKEYNFNKKEFFKIPVNGGIELNAWMVRPQDFQKGKKYPVYIYVYGGPGHQTVMNQWDFHLPWYEFLAQKGYIVVSVDCRGTGGQSAEFKKCTYRQLGKYETEDMIEVVKYLRNLAYVDSTRIGIQGWSFGGYLTLLCLTKAAPYFKAGIAIAPVTNWRFYDTIYTERYMGLPQNNPNGYDNNSALNFVNNLKAALLLVHGTKDDNVHFQNSIELIKKLVKYNKQFELLIYPDKAHGISGVNERLHLFTKITNFIVNNL